jgi:hypothetical protein
MRHPFFVEFAVAKIRFDIATKFELAGAFGRLGVDPGRSETLDVLAAPIRIDDVDGLVAAGESILNKGKKYAIFLFLAVKKRTNVTGVREAGTSKRDRDRSLHDGIPPKGISA